MKYYSSQTNYSYQKIDLAMNRIDADVQDMLKEAFANHISL